MNRNIYNLVFRPDVGDYVAASEIAKTKKPGLKRSAKVISHTLGGVIILCSLSLTGYGKKAWAVTDIIVDPSAPANERPQIIYSANGTPQINIHKPSNAGVSKSQYLTFDVGSEGLIINNSRQNAKTEIGGWVQANPWLAKGEARVILSQVNSDQVSRLHGYIEVAGGKADLIVANPSGIHVDGGGFINTNRSILTTGTPIFNSAGDIESFLVERGEVAVDGYGLDARFSNYTDILTYAVRVNGEIWSDELRIVTGGNQINYDIEEITPQVTDQQPEFALDVSALGGMYANKIRLIGTSEGVGVNQQGIVHSHSEMTLSVDGMLINKGLISSAGHLAISLTSDYLGEEGKLVSGGNLDVSTRGDLINTNGSISSEGNMTLDSGRINNASGYIGGSEIQLKTGNLDNSNGLLRAEKGDIKIYANNFISNDGRLLAGSNLEAQVSSMSGSGLIYAMGSIDLQSKEYLSGNFQIAAGQDIAIASGMFVSGDQSFLLAGVDLDFNLVRRGDITVESGSYLTFSGQAMTQGDLNLKSMNINLSSSQIKSGGLNINAKQSSVINTRDAKIHIDGYFNLENASNRNHQLDNRGGYIEADRFNVQVSALNNAGGHIVQLGDNDFFFDLVSYSGVGNVYSNDPLELNVFDNTQGVIYLGSPESKIFAKEIVNSHGFIGHHGEGGFQMTAERFYGNNGIVQSGGRLVFNSAYTENKSGLMQAGDISLRSGDLYNQSGKIFSHGSVVATIRNFNNDSGVMEAAGGRLEIVSDVFFNGLGQLYSYEGISIKATDFSTAGNIFSDAGISIISAERISNSGVIASGEDIDLLSKNIENLSSGLLFAGQRATGSNQGNLNIIAENHFGSSGRQQAGNVILIEAGDIHLGSSASHANHININATEFDVVTSYATLDANQYLNITANQLPGQRLINVGGSLSGSVVNIDTFYIDNASGRILQTSSGSGFNLDFGQDTQFNNTRGYISTGSQDLRLTASNFINDSGVVEHLGRGSFYIYASSVESTKGSLITKGHLELKSNQLINDYGLIQSHSTYIHTDQLSNRHGTITQSGTNQTNILAEQGFFNTGGNLVTQGALELKSNSLFDNRQGLMAALGDIHLNIQELNNERGEIISTAGGFLMQNNRPLNNASGLIQIRGDLNIRAQGIKNTQVGNHAAGFIQANNIHLDLGGHSLDNGYGTVVSGGRLDIKAGYLNNHAGLLQSNNDLLINLNSGKLVNSNAQYYDSGLGGIQSMGLLDIQSGQLDNNSGFISSKEILARTDDFYNYEGEVHSFGRLVWESASVDNRQGSIHAAGDLQWESASVDNRHGSIHAAGDLQWESASVDNRQGSIHASKNIDWNTQQWFNQEGSISTAGSAMLEIKNELDNTEGEISALETLHITSKDQRSLKVNNQSGKLLAFNEIRIYADTLTHDGEVSTEGDFYLDLGGDYEYSDQGTFLVGGKLEFRLEGSLRVSDHLQSGKEILLYVQNLDNLHTASISSERLELNIDQHFKNYGLIDGNEVFIKAGTLDNASFTLSDNEDPVAARIYADELWIDARALNNRSVIASRGNLNIGAGTLLNDIDARLVSLSNMSIGGTISDTGQVTGSATTISNRSALIEAHGNLHITANAITNSNEDFSTIIEVVSGPEAYTFILPEGWTEKFLEEDFEHGSWSRAGYLRFKHQPSALLPDGLAGQFLDIVGEMQCNEDSPNPAAECTLVSGNPYAKNHEIWTFFNIPTANLPDNWLYLAIGEPVQAPSPIPEGACDVAHANYAELICSQYHLEQESYKAYTHSKNTMEMLNSRINSHNSLLEQLVGRITTWNIIQADVTVSESQVDRSAPGTIQSGGSMSLNSQSIINDKSYILAGGSLQLVGGEIQNIEGEGEQITHEVGTTQRTYARWRGGFRRYHQRQYGNVLEYSPADVIVPIDVEVTRVEEFAFSSLASPVPVFSVDAAIELADLDLELIKDEVDIQYAGLTQIDAQNLGAGLSVSSQIGDAIAETNATIKGLKAPNLTNSTPEAELKVASQTSDVGNQVRTVQLRLIAPSSGMFLIQSGPQQSYLIETDPQFINSNQWLGSDYMLEQLAVDPQLVQKRIGDAFYEQEMIKQQVRTLTGQRYLGQHNNDEDQYRALMQAGVRAAERLNLRPGIALTAEQMAQLTDDIVWLVEQTITLADGQTQQVLVPQVYARPQPGDLLATGTLMAGRDVEINASGEFMNQGTLASRNQLSVSAQDLVNQGGNIQAGQMFAQVERDFKNIGGNINLQDGGYFDIGGNLEMHSESYQVSQQVGESYFDRGGISRIAGLSTQNADGGLIIRTGGDMNFTAAQLNLAGSGQFVAEGSIHLNHLVTTNEDTLHESNRNYVRVQTTDIHGSQINAGGSLLLDAQQQLIIDASSLKAEQDLQLRGVEGVQILAAQSQASFEGALHYSRSMGQQTTQTTQVNRQDWQGSELQAGGNLTINSDAGTVSIFASQVQSGQGTNIYGHEGVELVSGVDQYLYDYQRESRRTTEVNQTLAGFQSQSLARTSLTSDGEININSGGNILIQGASLITDQIVRVGDAQIRTDENGQMLLNERGQPIIDYGSAQNIQVEGVTLENSSWQESHTRLRTGLGNLVGALYVVNPAMALITPNFTIAEGESTRHGQVTEERSEFEANQVMFAAQERVQLDGARIHTQGENSSALIFGSDVSLGTLKNQHTTRHETYKTEISLVEASISKDEITLGGIEKTKESLTHTTEQTTHQGTEILSDQIFIHAENQLDVIAASLLNATTAGQVILSGDKINVTGIQNTTAETKTQETETTTLTVGVRNAYVDAALAVQALYEATKALDKANDAYRDAKRRVEKGELSESALKDYEINRATAAAQLAMAQIAAASAAYGAATAASSSMGTGFYASVGAQHTESSSSATVTQGEWQGSQIQAGNLTLLGGDATIQGSGIRVGQLNLNTQNTQFTAGVEDYSSQTHSSSKTASARVGTNGAAAVSLGNSQAQSQNSSTAYVNSQIQVGHLQSNSENLTLQGANLQTQTANLNVVNLTVESLQNTASSSNTSRSNNLGISVGSGGSVGVSLGHSQSQGNSQAQQVNQQTQLLIADGENSQITAQNTRLIGGLIANATQDEKGNLTDHGQLNLSTQTLSVSHLDNKTSSEQRGFGIQVSVSTQKNDSGTREVSGGSTTLSLQHQGHLTEGLTQATLGLGNIQVGGQTLSNHPDDNNRLEGLNRDLSQREITTKNQQTAGLNAGVTIDHRLLTEKGREEILQQQKDFVDNSKIVANAAGQDSQWVGNQAGKGVSSIVEGATSLFVDEEQLGVYASKAEDIIGAFGIVPTLLNNGGLFNQLPVTLGADDANQRQIVAVSAGSQYEKDNPDLGWVPITETQGYHLLSAEQQQQMEGMMVSTRPVTITSETSTFQNATNGMLNTESLALYNALTQTHDVIGAPNQEITFTLNYNPTRGLIADGVESGFDKLAVTKGSSLFSTSVARETGNFLNSVMLAQGAQGANFANHSQGNLLNYSGLMAVGVDDRIQFNKVPLGADENSSNSNFTFAAYGSPVNSVQFAKYLGDRNLQLSVSSVNPGDFVGERLGGNHGVFVNGQMDSHVSTVIRWEQGQPVIQQTPVIALDATTQPSTSLPRNNAVTDLLNLFGSNSTHSNYNCLGDRCGTNTDRNSGGGQ